MFPVLLKLRPRREEGQTSSQRDILVHRNSYGIGMTNQDRATKFPVWLRLHPEPGQGEEGQTYRQRDIVVHRNSYGIGMTNRDRVTMCPVLLKHKPRKEEGQTYRKRDSVVHRNS